MGLARNTYGPAHKQVRITADLQIAGRLQKIDRVILATYCAAWARWTQAEQQVKKLVPVVKSPSGYPIQNPYLAVANKAMSQVQKAAADLGMTPCSRNLPPASPINLNEHVDRLLEETFG